MNSAKQKCKKIILFRGIEHSEGHSQTHSVQRKLFLVSSSFFDFNQKCPNIYTTTPLLH